MNFFTGANPEDPRYYNIHTAPPPVLSNGTELYPGGLWGPGSRSTSETDGCYWNPPGSQHSQQQRSSGNIYSPNPEEMHRNATENEQENDETIKTIFLPDPTIKKKVNNKTIAKPKFTFYILNKRLPN